MGRDKSRRRYKKKRYTWPVIIITLVIAGRIALPYVLENYVSKTLNNIPGYSASVEDVDVRLWRGAYKIEGLILRKEDSPSDKPMLSFPVSDISIQWDALLDGRIVSVIKLQNPEFNYIFIEDEQDSQKADVDDWTKALTSLVPIDINHLSVYNGKANFVELSSDPEINMFLEKISLEATNLSNVVNQQKKLPSRLDLTAVSIGGGDVSLNGNMNILKEIPDMDMEFALKKADARAVNDLTRRYVGVDFESGTFELFSEIAIADGYLKGYIKPMFINTKLIQKDDEGGIFKKLWEGFVGLFKFVLKNQGTDTLATKVPLEGNLKEVKSGVLPTIFNIFENAWIDAFDESVDKDIEFEDAEKH